MVAIRRALADDFPEVYSKLLLEFRNPYLSREDYSNLFKRQWAGGEDWHGFVLDDKDALVGFLGLIFSKRMIKGREHRLCNFSHWIVKPGYRRDSMSLFFAATSLKGYTFTSFTPTRAVAPIYERLRWKMLERRCHIILGLPTPPLMMGRHWQVILDANELEGRLSTTETQLYRDHRPFKCRHAFVDNGRGDGCYLVYTCVRRKRLPFVLIHYIGNLDVFLECIALIRWKLCVKERAVGLLADDRYMGGQRVIGAHIYDGERRFFLSEELTRFDIDSLYSEYIVVNV